MALAFSKFPRRLIVLVSICALAILAFAPGIALAASITVTNALDETTNGDGCSLREAITNANDNAQTYADCGAGSGADVIGFTIPSSDPNCDALSGVCTILPTSELPNITDPVTINGYTQSGASVNTLAQGDNAALKVQLKGGFCFGGCYGLKVNTTNSTIKGLVINQWSDCGIFIQGDAASGNSVQGNFIGTDPTGMIGQGLQLCGVQINAPSNTVGGTTPAARNLISGNCGFLGLGPQSPSGVPVLPCGPGVGVVLNGNDRAHNNTIQGNYIGTDKNGTGAIPNTLAGVFIVDAHDNIVGGTTAAARNVISGNGPDLTTLDLNNQSGLFTLFEVLFGGGVVTLLPNATNNRIQGNYIGTTRTGTAALGNNPVGVKVIAAGGNYIGGTTGTTPPPNGPCTGACNLISGNGPPSITFITPTPAEFIFLFVGGGVTLFDFGNTTTLNRIQGNFIGTDKTGTAALSNYGPGGVKLFSTSNNTIGGATPAARNLISGNAPLCLNSGLAQPSLCLGGNGIVSFPNFFNLPCINDCAPPGQTSLAKYLYADPSSSLANKQFQFLGETYNVNFAAPASSPAYAKQDGARVLNFNAPVAPTVPGDLIQGNFIGTNVSGLGALPNASNGVMLLSQNNTVGGTQGTLVNTHCTGVCNLISGNGLATDSNAAFNSDGVLIQSVIFGVPGPVGAPQGSGNGASNNKVQGNFIGTDLTGLVALGNLRNGVEMRFDVFGTLVGDAVTQARNLISGNLQDGVEISYGSYRNRVQGNLIGLKANKGFFLGNRRDGVRIWYGSHDNLIGGLAHGMENHIAFNGGDGVSVGAGDFDDQTINNGILHNDIFHNIELGIQLVGGNQIDGEVTLNDPQDPDTGPNMLQNYPVLVHAVSDAGGTTVQGTLNSTPNTTFHVELFHDILPCDIQFGYGEGQVFFGAVNVTTDGSGNASFSVHSVTVVAPGRAVTATATDPNNNTSEFSKCAIVQ